jgi:5-methylthioadenosine/S-adenosylhomocysteine deaminase
MPLEAWLHEGIWPAERRWVSAEMVRDGTELAIAEMLRGGTTCFSDQYFFPEIVAEAAVDLSMRAVIATPVVDFPTGWAANAEEYLQKGADLVHDPYADHPLIETAFAPHSTFALSDESFAALRVLADQLDVRVQIHLHESAAEIDISMREKGKRPFQRLLDAGLVNASLLAVHAVHMNDALGTDGAASNNMLDLFSEMRTAALLAKATSGDASVVTANEALHMATMGGARALGLEHRIGSIEAGKCADLICVDLNRLNSQPVYDVVSQLVYAARSDQVTDVWVAGRHQLDNGRFAHIDTDDLLARGNEWRERIAATGEIQ